MIGRPTVEHILLFEVVAREKNQNPIFITITIFSGTPLVEVSKRVHYDMAGVLFNPHHVEFDHLLLRARGAQAIRSRIPTLQQTRTSQVPHAVELQTCRFQRYMGFRYVKTGE